MEQTIPPFFLFVSLALCLSMSHAISPTSPPILQPNDATLPVEGPVAGITVDEACSKVKDPSYCIKTLSSRQETKHTLSMKDMAFLALQIASEDVDDSFRYLSEMPVNDNKPALEDVLTDCTGQYEDAGAQVEDSMNAFVAGALSDVKTWMSAAIKNGETCNVSIKDAKLEDFMGTRNEDLAKICGLAIDLSELALKKQ